MHSAHTYNARTVEKPDKTHHLKLNEFMRHGAARGHRDGTAWCPFTARPTDRAPATSARAADKCLQLGELPFLSGGMKATPGF